MFNMSAKTIIYNSLFLYLCCLSAQIRVVDLYYTLSHNTLEPQQPTSLNILEKQSPKFFGHQNKVERAINISVYFFFCY